MSFNHRFSWILIQSLQVIVLSTPKSSCHYNWTFRTVCEKMSFKSFRNSDTGNELETRTSWTVTFRAMSRTLVHLLIIYKLFTSSLQDSSFALNQSSFDTEFGWNPVTFKLQSYDAEELVRCFEKMAVPSRKFVHFVFVGDSRVRQYFYSFVQVKFDSILTLIYLRVIKYESSNRWHFGSKCFWSITDVTICIIVFNPQDILYSISRAIGWCKNISKLVHKLI